MLAQVTTNRFCAGLVIRDGVVVEAAPILRHTIGWRTYRLLSYYRGLGHRVEMVW